MTVRIEPTLTRLSVGGRNAVRPIATPIREITSPQSPPVEETRRKYPRLAKVFFAFAAVSVVAAIVVSPTILFLTAWFLLAGYICEVGSEVGTIQEHGGVSQSGSPMNSPSEPFTFPGGPAALSAFRFNPHNPLNAYRK
jgi:hypothetical protein